MAVQWQQSDDKGVAKYVAAIILIYCGFQVFFNKDHTLLWVAYMWSVLCIRDGYCLPLQANKRHLSSPILPVTSGHMPARSYILNLTCETLHCHSHLYVSRWCCHLPGPRTKLLSGTPQRGDPIFLTVSSSNVPVNGRWAVRWKFFIALCNSSCVRSAPVSISDRGRYPNFIRYICKV